MQDGQIYAQERVLMPYENSEGPDRPVHRCILSGLLSGQRRD